MAVELVAGFIALIIALFAPGYFLTLGFFPSRNDISGIERIVFSFVFSVTFLPLLILLENQLLGIPINFASVSATFLLLIILGLFSYFARTGKIPLPELLYAVFPKVPKEEAFPIIPKFK